MVHDASGGWRDERSYAGLSRSLETENNNTIPKSRSDEGQKKKMDDEMKAEDISKLLTDGSGKEFEEESRKLENDTWALYHLSRELNERYEEEGEYWVLEVVGDSIEPVFKVDENKQEIVTHPNYNIDETEIVVELEDETFEAHPFGILEYTGEKDIFFGKEYRTEELEVPMIEGSRLEQADLDRVTGSYIAPGLEEDYRGAAEKSIERVYG